MSYPSLRKAMYPNLIFFYGPVVEQVEAASRTLAQNINYVSSGLPPNANMFINNFKKTCNYVIEGSYTSKR